MRFLKRVFVGFGGCLGVLLGAGLAAVGVALVIGAVMRDRKDSAGILVIDLSASLSDRGSAPSIVELVQGETSFELPLQRAVAAVRRATKDGAIQGILLTGSVNGGMTVLGELRAALDEFAGSGKPIHAWYPSYDDKTYFLASVAKDLAVEPFGALALDGFGSQVMYYKNALDRFGVEVQVTRVGKYKSAVEPYLRSEMSAENREQLTGILTALSDAMRGAVERSRGTTRAELEAIAATQPILSAETALERKLVDRVIPFSTLAEELEKVVGKPHGDQKEQVFRQVTLVDYARGIDEPKERGGIIGVVFAEGEIVDGESSAQVGGDTVARQLRELRTDDAVKAVVLRVNSPGGSATASEVIAHEVRRLREVGKPVVVSMADLAASGGYWISCEADAIVAHPATITGSIGVFGMYPNAAKVIEELGVNREVVKVSPHADRDSPLKRLDEVEIAALQTTVDAVYDGFLDRVARGRGKPREAIHEIAQGRVWSGKAALELGLVDRLGSFDDAVALAAEKSNLGKDPSLRFVLPKPTFASRVMRSLATEASGRPAAEELLGSLAKELAPHLRELLAVLRGGTFARMPFFLEVR